MSRAVCLLVVVVCLSSCNKAPTSKTSTPALADVQTPTTVESPAQPPNSANILGPQPGPNIAKAKDTLDDASTMESANPEKNEPDIPAPPPRTARVMLLTREGPLLIDLHVTHEGESVLAQFDQTIDRLTKLANGTSNGPLTWETLLQHPRFRNGQFGNPSVANRMALADTIRQYDTTQNGRVDRNEFVGYLTNGQSSQALSFFTSPNRREENRVDSTIRKWLDQNGNRRLDANELDSASERLQLRDFDDDGILTIQELSNVEPTNNGMAINRTRRGSTYRPKVAWLIDTSESNRSWSDIRVAWESLYAAGQPVLRSDFDDVGQRIFAELDLDQNGELDSIEMEMLAEIHPDISLHIEFSTTPPDIKILSSRLPKDTIHALLQHQSNRITLRLPETSLDLFAIATTNNSNVANQAEGLLQSADFDDDEELSPKEYESLGPNTFDYTFEEADANRDNSVSRDEIEELFAQRSAITNKQLRVEADDQTDAIFPLLDLNADSRLDSREISQVPNSLRALDRNGDSTVRLRELPGSMLLGVALGNGTPQPMGQRNRLTVPPVRPKVYQAEAPDWFSGMDQNQDQTVTWREFLGTKEQFRDLDFDANGYVDPGEATRG